jgi:GntR family transcriptional regulator
MRTPMYQQIADDLQAQIDSGDLEPGQKLRTEIELREHYEASRNTVRDAIKLLTARGFVETKAGQGTFVIREMKPYITTLTGSPKVPTLYGEGDDSAAGDTTRGDRVLSSTEPQVEIQKATAGVASYLQVPEGDQVISRHQKRSVDGTPYSMQTSFYKMEFALQGASKLIQAGDIPIGTMRYLEDTLKLKQEGYRDRITVRAADGQESQFFSLSLDGRVGVFEVFRTAYDQNGNPMRLTVTVYPTDRNEFIVNVGEVPSSPEIGQAEPG